MDLHRRVHAARGGAADQQRDVEAVALHLGGDVRHLVERGRDQAGEPDDVDPLGLRRLEDLRRRHHDAEVDDLVVVAGEHDADDVLADVVHVALDGRHQDLAGALAPAAAAVRELLRLHVGQQHGHRLLHHPRGLHHLRQEHLARAEQVADDVHPRHQRALDDVQRPLGGQARLLGVGLDELGDAVDQRVLEPLLDRPLAPGEVALARLAAARALEALGEVQQPLGRVRAAVQHHVLAGLAQLGLDRVVDRELAGVDDAHVHAGVDGVVEEDRVHRLAHRLVAAEREREVRDAARDVDVRQRLDDPPRRLDEVDAVVVVLLDAGRDREDVRIEDDVLGREADLLGQQPVGAACRSRPCAPAVSAWPCSSKAITTTAAP